MGRKTKYSAKSEHRIEIKATQIQKEILSQTQLICRAKGLPHTQHDVLIAGLNMYYDYLFRTHQKTS